MINMNDQYTIKVSGGEIGHIGPEYRNSSVSQDDAILKELQELQQKLKETDRGIARMVGDLQDAVKKQDKPKIREMIQDLTTGTIGAVIEGLASATLKTFFGLS